MDRKTKPVFSPLCDVHHVPMRRVMLENLDETNSHHACQRRDCTRVFRLEDGYLDFTQGEFDTSRASGRVCHACGAKLFLADVNDSWKTETWECSRAKCKSRTESRSPSSR